MREFLTRVTRLFSDLSPVSDTQAFCAIEVVREETRVHQQMRAEYSRLFATELARAPSPRRAPD